MLMKCQTCIGGVEKAWLVDGTVRSMLIAHSWKVARSADGKHTLLFSPTLTFSFLLVLVPSPSSVLLPHWTGAHFVRNIYELLPGWRNRNFGMEAATISQDKTEQDVAKTINQTAKAQNRDHNDGTDSGGAGTNAEV